jgi:hypothetical protein
MIFAHLADDLYPYAGLLGLAAGLGVGLYSYFRGKDGKPADAAAPVPVDPDERACPHCGAYFSDAGDAFCPECRQPLDDTGS